MEKRIAVLCLSFSTIVCYGYALGGMGGYLFGKGRPLIVAAGLIGGTACAFIAMRVWRIYLDEIAKEDAETLIQNQSEDDGAENHSAK